MKQKLLLLILALCTTMGAWATVTQPTLTTDTNNPVYYTIKNFRSSKYAAYTGANSQLAQVTTTTSATIWYFVENGEGVSIIPADDPTKKLASTTSATDEGIVWYLKESYKTGYFCISKSSTDVTSGTNNTQDCWDDQGSHTKIGYWKSVSGDADGTAWIIERAKTIPTGYYYFKGLANDRERHPYLYSDFVTKGDNYTYHHTLPNSPKNGDIWKITNNGATFTVSNGEGLPVIPDNGTSYNTLTIGSSEVGPDIYFTEAINLTTWGDGSKITTWTGHPDASDNHWTFECADVSDGVYDVVIVGHPNGYVTYNGQNAKNGGFFVAASITTEDLEPADIADYTYSKNVTDHTITITYTANFTYTLTDANGKTYSWSASGSVGVSPAITGCAGYTLSNEVWNEGSKTYTADITFPFPVSSNNVTNWTYINIFDAKPNYKISNGHWFYCHANDDGDKIIVHDKDEPTNESGAIDKYKWSIIPSFDNGTFTFTIKNALNNKYIYHDGNESYSNHTGIKLGDAGVTLKYVKDSSADKYYWYMPTESKYLSANSVSGDATQRLGALDAVHDGESVGFYTPADFATLLANLKTARNKFIAYLPSFSNGTYTETVEGTMMTTNNQQATDRNVVKDPPTAYFTASQFETYTDNYNNAVAGLRYVVPTFFRVKNVDGSKYVKAYWRDYSNYIQLAFAADGTDASSIFYLNASNNIMSYYSGLYLFAINCTAALNYSGYNLSNYKCTYEFLPGTDVNRVYVHTVDNPIGWGGEEKYWIATETNVGRGTAPTANSDFLIEEVTSLPITMNEVDNKYYGTINLPVAVTIPEGVYAYKAAVAGDVMTLTKVVENGVLAANIPVVLYSASEVTSLAISAEAGTGADDDDFSGTTAAITAPAGTNYVLSYSPTEGVGFYKYTGSVIPGFKAYYNEPVGGGVKGFAFSFEDVETAIRAIEDENNDLEIYDIAGRRVQQAQKGLYIVNGKKVMFK